jgi:hypothetical protein
LANPGAGKYRAEIFPLPDVNPSIKYCVCLFHFGLFNLNRWAIPFKRTALITYDDARHIAVQMDLPLSHHGHEFRKAHLVAYPYCQIFKLRADDLTVIRFMDEKEMRKWERPLRLAVERFARKIARERI